ncbi:MAG: protein kinase [Acidobacteria bacterium]|nr:protein kinase [Acidobacteriota bacterium]MBV9436760.1 protein kinase [Acidobacteriota bacterium]
MLGKTIGHYRIDAKLGAGGMGAVYRAHDEMLKRDVAIKFLAKTVADKVARDHLLEEARISSSLSHPNVCTIYEVGKHDDDFYVVMELIDGRTLHSIVGNAGLAPETALRYAIQIADALSRAHERGVIHRDLKSSNVMVTGDGRVKVLDFGLAMSLRKQQIDDATRSVVDLGSGSELAGTLAYMAPEILRADPATPQSDLWAFGVVLYEMAAGKLPFAGRTGLELASQIFHQTPAALPPHISPGYSGVVQRCLAKEPAVRFQRASEVRAALEATQSASIAAQQPQPSDQSGPRTIFFRGVEHLAMKNNDVLLVVGTNKGLFLFRSSRERKQWKMAGPYFHGRAIYSAAYDSRAGRHRLWISVSSYWGTYLHYSDDFGRIWTNPIEASIKFSADSGATLKNIWQICLGSDARPDQMFCGVEPAALFRSEDNGETWSLERGLFDHPHRPRWRPGNGGLCLHTIIPDPVNADRVTVAISSAGVYRTDDGGRTWQARNLGIRVVFEPEKHPEFGQCIHKIAIHPTRPERMFLQNHWGLYRSDNYGDSWSDISHGVPSDFGFCTLVHPHNPDWVYIIPVESDEFRCTPEGKLRVYRTRNAGGSWEPLTRGLPQHDAYETVLRDGLCSDSLDPAGIYFGTRSGKLFASTDDGKNWTKLADGLPQIVSVRAAIVTDLGKIAPGTSATGRKKKTAPARRSAPKTRRKR